MNKTNLLIIDAQNDFCHPGGSLYVQGADHDSRRLADFIYQNSGQINEIYVTLDSHHNYDVAHPLYWRDSDGNHPEPFTIISVNDLEKKKWTTTKDKDSGHGMEYVKALAENGRYQLCIWPPHCLIGSWGTQIQDDVFNSISQWEISNVKQAVKIYKGNNPGTEHYGAFEAEVPQLDDASTQLKTDIIKAIKNCDSLLIAGQALDYCVANTIRQMADSLSKKEINKVTLLEDCCSSVDPTSGLSSKFLHEMAVKGMKTAKSSEVKELK